uniref:Putative glycosyltransferase n=1 Tax=viral metagenome TaxID=1070528 RepID=A0A6M3KA62_9ZZZZ
MSQDYPQELIEIIVVDGMSTDRTLEIVNRLKKKRPDMKVLMNPKGYKYPALNLALKEAVGDYIAIADAHSLYPRSYIRELAETLDQGKADNVGGGRIFHPRTKGLLAKAITFALTEPFGLCT